MNPKSIPSLAVALLIGIGGYGVWHTLQSPDYTLPSENNLQTLILQEFETPLDLPSARTQEDMPLKSDGPISAATLHDLAVSILQNWDNGPAPYATDGESLYEMTDVYGLLASALRTYNQLGGLPAEVPLQHMVRPGQAISIDYGVQVNTLELLAAVDTLEIHEKTALASVLDLGSSNITGTQMLHGMAQLVLLLENGDDLPTMLYIEPAKSL